VAARLAGDDRPRPGRYHPRVLRGRQGGHNDESHNDIGNYVVYYDGQPLLIDVGRGTYTSKTFSNRRYEIWYNRSDYHNVPTVNGVTQAPGHAFKATGVAYQSKAFIQHLAFNM
jgi:hypothetical protein